ncbi:MAG: phosphoribosylamine--glycine ligase [Candidatus Edwardsbacteria bacterium]|jgi:phosphoribosylamine--glycine ligase|nr:phosphoribosylamine--glycine ligase [Candidatus Edwardsbacteria bacterium]
MKVMVIGSGGREHALVWKLAQSPSVKKIYCAPGNPGIARQAERVDIAAGDLARLRDFAAAHAVDLTVVGPDDCLAAGAADLFAQRGLRVFGPTREAARLEWSKSFAKELMREAGIPTADFATFTDHDAASEFLRSRPYPLVVKASGLALGKGVTVCRSREEAERALRAAMVDRAFGDAGCEVVIEEFLEGDEVSVHAFCDGATARLFPPARDHKALLDGGRGPNTGGMGTYAPVPGIDEAMMAEIERTVVAPVLRAMAGRGAPFRGCLYPGLIRTAAGFKVLEFNARFGDPETQSLMRLLASDLAEVLLACAEGRLTGTRVAWSGRSAACLVAASGGYPGAYRKGLAITGLDRAEADPDVVVFHAGTALRDGVLVTNGGRVLGVSAVADALPGAVAKCYAAIGRIGFDGKQYRTDIGGEVTA